MKKLLLFITAILVLALATTGLVIAFTPKHEHNHALSVVYPTCEDEGAYVYTCECGDSYKKTIRAKGHVEEVLEAKDPTCTDTGLTAGKKCTVCNKVLVSQQEIPANGHDLVITEAVNATCTTDGSTKGEKCNVCDYLVLPETIPSPGHDIVTIEAKAADCENEGNTAGEYCTACDYEIPTEVIPAEGHSWDGDYDEYCNDCGKERNVPHSITVTGGTADKAEAKAGEIVTLTANEPADKMVFSYWTLNGVKIEGNTFEMPNDVAVVEAVFVSTVIVLDTPDNTDSKALYSNGTAIEIDRIGTTLFGTGVADVMFYIYTSPDADKNDYVGKFIMSGEYDGVPVGSIVTCFRDLDGNEYRIIYGGNTNYWATDYNTFFSMLKNILGYEYSDGQTYYYAVQLLAVEGGDYSDSDISAIGPNGFARDASKGTEKYTITVENGTIDGSLTTITAGYGVNIKLSAIMPEGKEFGYWTYVIYNEDGSETLGTIVSSDSDAVYTVNSSIVLRAVEKPADRIKLDAPTNANNEMFKVSGAITEYDRQKNEDGSAKTAFVDGVGRVRFYMYADVTINGVTERVIVSWFDIDKDGYMYDYNGNKTMGGNGGKCLGIAGDFYGSDGNWHNFIKASFNQGADAQGLGITWVDTTFYVACQSISDNPLYENSDIGAMGQGWVNI